MRYKKAQDILPKDIINLIQSYADGVYIYIPRKDENKKSWGDNSGTIKKLEYRNKEIADKYDSGTSVNELTKIYYLSESSIRRIISLKKGNE